MEVGVGLHIVRNIESEMPINQQNLARAQGGHMRKRHGKNIGSINKIVTPQGTSRENLKIGRELGVPAQEERDPMGGTRAMRGREVEEITTRKVEETTGETTAMVQVGEGTALRDRVEETTAQGTDKMEVEAGVEETPWSE